MCNEHNKVMSATCTPTDHLHSQLADLEYQKAKAVLESNQTSGDLSMYNR